MRLTSLAARLFRQPPGDTPRVWTERTPRVSLGRKRCARVIEPRKRQSGEVGFGARARVAHGGVVECRDRPQTGRRSLLVQRCRIDRRPRVALARSGNEGARQFIEKIVDDRLGLFKATVDSVIGEYRDDPHAQIKSTRPQDPVRYVRAWASGPRRVPVVKGVSSVCLRVHPRWQFLLRTFHLGKQQPVVLEELLLGIFGEFFAGHVGD